ncbi:hypothetical protein ACFL2H_09350, partial [Planctomycetota bacterium]
CPVRICSDTSTPSTESTPIIGEIVSHGRLVDENQSTLGTFEQTTRLNRGSRVLRIRVAVDMQHTFSDDVWNSYLCSRFAWPNEAADLIAGAMDRAMPFAAKRFEAPMLVDGETSREFEFGIGIDLANPARDAIDFLSVPTVAHDIAIPSEAQTGWLFHIDSKNVVATSWHAIEDEKQRGFRVRIVETTGRPAQINIKAFRDIASARKIDFENETVCDCAVKGDAFTVNLDGHEWAEVEGLF